MASEEPSVETADSSLEMVSQAAEHERRRKQVQQELAARPVPDFVISTIHSEVLYVIDPAMLPFAHMDFAQFAAALQKAYKMHFHKPEPSATLQVSKKEDTIDASQLKEFLEEDSDPRGIEFENGRFPVSRDEFVPIHLIRLTNQNVHVAAKGNSTVADLVAKEVVEALWASTGTPKRWESIQSGVGLVSYGTATKVNFGFPLEYFLTPAFRQFIDEEVKQGTKYGAHMTAYSALDNFKPSFDNVVSATLDTLRLRVHVFNTLNGRSETSKFDLAVMAKHEQGKGICVAVSEMPFDTHVACLAALRDKVMQAMKN